MARQYRARGEVQGIVRISRVREALQVFMRQSRAHSAVQRRGEVVQGVARKSRVAAVLS